MSVSSVLVPAAVIVTAHRILKSLHEQVSWAHSEHTQAALTWLEQRSFIEALIDEAGTIEYEITQWGLDALLGRGA